MGKNIDPMVLGHGTQVLDRKRTQQLSKTVSQLRLDKNYPKVVSKGNMVGSGVTFYPALLCQLF